MKLIIDISENLYNFVNTKRPNGCYNNFDEFDCCNISKCIRNGIILPKGHGRLIDADYLREDFKNSKRISFAERMDISCIVDHAPTIIEADKGDIE